MVAHIDRYRTVLNAIDSTGGTRGRVDMSVHSGCLFPALRFKVTPIVHRKKGRVPTRSIGSFVCRSKIALPAYLSDQWSCWHYTVTEWIFSTLWIVVANCRWHSRWPVNGEIRVRSGNPRVSDIQANFQVGIISWVTSSTPWGKEWVLTIF